MRIYYIFNIKDEYVSLYENNPCNLYLTLKQLYNLRDKDLEYGYNMYTQLINRIDKNYLDRKLFIYFHDKMRYTKGEDVHIINNLYKDEVSILKVKSTYIILNCNRSYTEFFNILKALYKNLFICDFINHDYFFIRDLKTLV